MRREDQTGVCKHHQYIQNITSQDVSSGNKGSYFEFHESFIQLHMSDILS